MILFIISKFLIFAPEMEKPELLSLITLAKEKNQKAQTKLINLFWTDVFSFILKKTGNENLADELTVSVFSKVLAKLDLYDENFQFKTWVLTIAQNTVIDYWRKKSREAEDPTEDLQEVKNRFEKSPEEILIAEQEEKKIMDTVAKMDVNYQKIIQLRFFEEKSIKEIAEELGLSVANTKVRIMRAKKVLAELLNENE